MTTDDARQLARTVAAKGGCGSFDDFTFDRATDVWVFECQRQPEIFYEIVVYGSEDARSSAIKSLDERKETYFAKNFYAIVVVSDQTHSGDSALAPFKG
jgi:hypothetical protein